MATVTTASEADPRDRRREQRGWYFYDWANSAFPTTVVAVFLGPYLTTVTEAAAGAGGFVYPLGIPIRAGSLFPYVLSLSVLLQVLVLPLIGAITDRTQRKKQLLALFAYVGALATMGMYLIEGSTYLLGGVLFLVANLSFGASIVVYNAFLPEIAKPDERDRVSSRGWGLGYLGGGLLLAVNLALFSAHEALGLSEGHAVRISLLSAGAWWALFALIPLRTLRNRRRPVHSSEQGAAVVTGGFRQLFDTLRAARLPANAPLSRRVPALQRRHPDGGNVGRNLRGLGARTRAGHPYLGGSHGTVRRVCRSPLAGRARAYVRCQTGYPG